MIREFGGQGRGAFGVRNEEARKIGRFGTRMKMRSEDVKIVGQFLRFPFFLWHMRAIHDNGTSRKRTGGGEEEDGKRRGEREIDKRCKVPFVMVSYSIYRDQFRDLSVVSEFTVPREIGTLRKNVMCTHIRRRSSRTSRRRVRSRLDSLLGRW